MSSRVGPWPPHRTRLACALVLSVLLILSACVPASPSSPAAARLAHYVARVQIACPNGEVRNGSGVVISANGDIATAYHLVEPAEHMASCTVRVGIGARLNEDVPLTYEAFLAARDPAMDLAILSIRQQPTNPPLPTPLPYAPLATTPPRVGEMVHVLGFPALAEGLLAYDSDTVLSLGSCDTAESCWLLTEAFASWGSSGGPVFNEQGELVGIVLGQRAARLRGIEQRITAVRPYPPLLPLLASIETTSTALVEVTPAAPTILQVDEWQVKIVGPLGVNWRVEPSTAGGADTIITTLPPGSVLHVIPPGKWQGWWATVDNRGRMGWVKERTERTTLVQPYMTPVTSRLTPGERAVVTCLTQAPCALPVYSPGYTGEDALLGSLAGGTLVTVLEPPVWVDGLIWWRVGNETIEGWLPEVTAEGYRLLSPLPSIPLVEP